MPHKRAQAAMVNEDDVYFKLFWDTYPKRVAKKEARIAWLQIQPTPEMVERMVATLKWQSQLPEWTKDGGQYVPFPASWLRAARFDDEQQQVIHQKALSDAVSDPMRAWLEGKTGHER